jgi:uncharacterized coiled-coil protein SlyX
MAEGGAQGSRGSASGGIVMWLLGLATTIALGGGSFWLTTVDTEINRLRDTVSLHDKMLSRIESGVYETQRRLDRIETKLDTLIAKLTHRNS